MKPMTHELTKYLMIPKKDYQSLMKAVCACPSPPAPAKKKSLPQPHYWHPPLQPQLQPQQPHSRRQKQQQWKKAVTSTALLRQQLNIPDAYSPRSQHQPKKKIKKQQAQPSPKRRVVKPKKRTVIMDDEDWDMLDLSQPKRGQKRSLSTNPPPTKFSRLQMTSMLPRKRERDSSPVADQHFMDLERGWKRLHLMPPRGQKRRRGTEEEEEEEEERMFKRMK